MNTKFIHWFNTFIEEKQIDPEQIIEAEGPSGTNFMPLEIVFDQIRKTTTQEQRKIKEIIVQIDFRNGDILHFFRHLAQRLAV